MCGSGTPPMYGFEPDQEVRPNWKSATMDFSINAFPHDKKRMAKLWWAAGRNAGRFALGARTRTTVQIDDKTKKGRQSQTPYEQAVAFSKNEEFWIKTWYKMQVVHFKSVRDEIRKDEEYRRRLSGYITNNTNYLRASGYWWSKYVRYAFLLDKAMCDAEVPADKAVGASSDTEGIDSDDPEKK